MSRVHVRELADLDELEQCVELQKKTWGTRFDDIASAALMLVSQKIGGIAAGAFDEGGSMLGILFGLTGVREGVPVHWSHMLAVEPSRRGRGIGRLLKLYQRQRVLDLGADTVYWTFDPLESRNASLNLNRLKVQVYTYVVDMYGSGETSPLHRGIGTDRLIVRWDLRSDRVAAAIRDDLARMVWHDGEAEAEIPFGSQTGTETAEVRVSEGRPTFRAAGPALVEIPANIQRLKASDADLAKDWRTYVRASFTRYLDHGYTVRSFVRDPRTARCFYILEKE